MGKCNAALATKALSRCFFEFVVFICIEGGASRSQVVNPVDNSVVDLFGAMSSSSSDEESDSSNSSDDDEEDEEADFDIEDENTVDGVKAGAFTGEEDSNITAPPQDGSSLLTPPPPTQPSTLPEPMETDDSDVATMTGHQVGHILMLPLRLIFKNGTPHLSVFRSERSIYIES